MNLDLKLEKDMSPNHLACDPASASLFTKLRFSLFVLLWGLPFAPLQAMWSLYSYSPWGKKKLNQSKAAQNSSKG